MSDKCRKHSTDLAISHKRKTAFLVIPSAFLIHGAQTSEIVKVIRETSVDLTLWGSNAAHRERAPPRAAPKATLPSERAVSQTIRLGFARKRAGAHAGGRGLKTPEGTETGPSGRSL